MIFIANAIAAAMTSTPHPIKMANSTGKTGLFITYPLFACKHHDIEFFADTVAITARPPQFRGSYHSPPLAAQCLAVYLSFALRSSLKLLSGLLYQGACALA